MKEKILALLKTKYANLGFGDKAFDGVADYLSKTVTEETQIETAIAGVENLLKAFQGDIDKVRGEKTTLQKQYDELKAKAEGGKPNPQPGEEKKPDDVSALIDAAIAEKIKPLQDKLSDYEKIEAQTAFSSKILAKADELGIPKWRIQEGFTIAQDADDNAINTYLSTIKQNIVTAGLERSNGFPVDPKVKPTDEQTDAILDKIM